MNWLLSWIDVRAILGYVGAILAHRCAILGSSGANAGPIFKPCWRHLRPSDDQLGPNNALNLCFVHSRKRGFSGYPRLRNQLTDQLTDQFTDQSADQFADQFANQFADQFTDQSHRDAE